MNGGLNLAFDYCRCEYIKLLQGDDSLWESFPKALERQEGARKYISTFRAPFQEPPLNPKEVHVLRVCSLLVIPPPPPGNKALPGRFPDDLLEINLSVWADLVQDVVVGQLALPHGMHNCLFPEVTKLLLHLESVTQVVFCHRCYLPGANCRCLGMSSLAPSPSWSQVAELTPGYGTLASTGAMTTLSTSLQGAAGLAPLPGLSTPGMASIWDPPHPDFPALQQQQVPSPPYRPSSGRGAQLSTQLKAIQDRRAQGLQGPKLVLPPPGSQSAMPYQQQVQLPVRATGPRVSFTPATKPAPTGSQDTQEQGRLVTRPATRDHDQSRVKLDNCSRGASARWPPCQLHRSSGGLSHKPQAASTSITPSQQHGAAQAPSKNPLENLNQHRSSGWKKDLDFYLGAYF